MESQKRITTVILRENKEQFWQNFPDFIYAASNSNQNSMILTQKKKTANILWRNREPMNTHTPIVNLQRQRDMNII